MGPPIQAANTAIGERLTIAESRIADLGPCRPIFLNMSLMSMKHSPTWRSVVEMSRCSHVEFAPARTGQEYQSRINSAALICSGKRG